MARVFALGHPPSIEELRALTPAKALGAVRVSVGIATPARYIHGFVVSLRGFVALGG